MTFAVTNTNIEPPCNSKTITKRNINQYTMDLFKNYLDSLTWTDVTQCNDVNTSLDIFLNHFNIGFELCFPFITQKLNKNIHPKNKFMTPGLLISRKTKLNLHKSYLLQRTNHALDKYKTYRNLYNTVLRSSKKLYYESALANSKKDPKKTWHILNELISKKTAA